jgi:hypothetical protein
MDYEYIPAIGGIGVTYTIVHTPKRVIGVIYTYIHTPTDWLINIGVTYTNRR